MGKHNGKARKCGLSVGSALVNKARREGRTGLASAHLYTTDTAAGNNMQSVIESNDLQEMMSMAELADRDFAADKTQVLVLNSGPVSALDAQRAAQERAAAEERHRHRLRIPRRPEWSQSTTPDELDAQERASFLEWRRDLAALEGDDLLILTPFEKNLEVWRQLWRVVERSEAVVQVVDARDPLTYRSEDLEGYCREVHPSKRSFLLLNKADLLPEALRSAWADYFDDQGIPYAFWSAKIASEEVEASDSDDDASDGDEGASNAACDDTEDPRAKLLTADELMDVLEKLAIAAVHDSESRGVERASRGERVIVGLTGYPNVGKSSTINALFGSKKTAVAATPGKTKHFQTLNVSDSLCLCDCPGLVMPQFAHSKAEMVAAGVIPIDRLTDIRAPVANVAERVSRQQLEKVYGVKLPAVKADEDPERPPTAQELLRAFCVGRGWVTGSTLPDETRAGRRILKDYVEGRILACKPPPGASSEIIALTEAIAGRKAPSLTAAAVLGEPALTFNARDTTNAGTDGTDGAGPSSFLEGNEEAELHGAAGDIHDDEDPSTVSMVAGTSDAGALDAADLDLLDSLDVSEKRAKPVRAAHKFHKKPVKGKARSGGGIDGGIDIGLDGMCMAVGKKGGIIRVSS